MNKTKKSILFIAPYPVNKAPSQRLKYEQYYFHLEKNGYNVVTHSFVSEKFWEIIYSKGNIVKKIFYTISGYINRVRLLLTIPFYNVVYVHLWITPLGPPLFEWLVRKLCRKLVYDIDDLIYLGNTTESNSIIKWIKGRKKPAYLMKHADHVIVCTPKLQEFALQYNIHVTDISSTIDTDKYKPLNNYSNNHKLILGWSGSHSTVKYLYLLEDVLKELNETHEFKLLVIGDKHFNIEGLDIETKAWSAQSEVEELQRIDIGLYPLPDEEWVYGKSGLKALQYMALGIPTVATGIGANFRIIKDGYSGYLVNSSHEWRERLIQLLENPELRKSIGSRGREVVESKYSVKSTAPVYYHIINDLLD